MSIEGFQATIQTFWISVEAIHWL